MASVVLASTSPHRQQLLGRLGLAFATEAPGVDEQAAKQGRPDPAVVVRALARQKAEAVASRHRGGIVIGSDQAAVLDGELLGKPGDAAGATAQLRRLQGREHFLLTAVAIAHAGGVVEFVDTATLTMRRLDDGEIARYVAAERPFDCAGSYKVEGLGIALFDRIEAADHTAIMGLPLLRLCQELRALGVPVP